MSLDEDQQGLRKRKWSENRFLDSDEQAIVLHEFNSDSKRQSVWRGVLCVIGLFFSIFYLVITKLDNAVQLVEIDTATVDFAHYISGISYCVSSVFIASSFVTARVVLIVGSFPLLMWIFIILESSSLISLRFFWVPVGPLVVAVMFVYVDNEFRTFTTQVEALRQLQYSFKKL